MEANKYEYPRQGWWQTKERIARGMTENELEFAAEDAFEAAQVCGPDTQGKYMDEVSVYRRELAKRGA